MQLVVKVVLILAVFLTDSDEEPIPKTVRKQLNSSDVIPESGSDIFVQQKFIFT